MVRIAWAASLLVATSIGRAAAAPSEAEELTVPQGAIVIDGFLEVNLADGAAFKPVSVSPDVWYGVNDLLTVGLIHSSVAATGFLGGVGDALCLTGEENGCSSIYPGVGVDARYRLKAPWTVDGGIYVRDFDPFALAIKVGVSGRWRFDKIAVEVQPNIFFGVTERDAGNEEVLSIPVTGSYEVAPKIEVAAQTGVQMPFDGAGDLFRIPLSLAARYQVDEKLSAGLVLTLPFLIGGSATLDGIDARTIMLGGSYAL